MSNPPRRFALLTPVTTLIMAAAATPPAATADDLLQELKAENKVRSVWCMNLDGTGRRLVARGGREPCWSADGRGIVYVKSEFEKFTAMDFATKGLFVYDLSLGMGDLDFSGPEPRVVNVRNAITSEKPIKVQHVDWSPDGKYLAFSRGPYQNRGLGLSPALVGLPAPGWDICVADASTTNRWVAITTDGKSNKEPDWIPFR